MSALCAALIVAGLATRLPAAGAATGDGSPTDPTIAFVGRWDTSNASAYVPYWAGASFTTGIIGATVKLEQRKSIDLYVSVDGAADEYLTKVSGTARLAGLATRRAG